MNKQQAKCYHAIINDCNHVHAVKSNFEDITNHNYNIKFHYVNYI